MNALTRISHKTQLYKKVGKKYIEHNDPWALDGLQDGWWLIKVAPGSKTIRSIVYPHKDWQWFIDKHGKEFSTIYFPSFHENAEKIVEALLTK